MAIESLRLYNFRNLTNAVIETNSHDVFLVGENGHGKTNFLEAIYFVCYASSFRTKRDDHLCKNGETEMLVEASYVSGDERRSVSVKQRGGGKEIVIDGSPVRDRREIVGAIPCIVFCHDDIAFVSGPPEMQRWFMNQTLALLDTFFVDELRRYSRILRSRNIALRERKSELLDALDYQLVETGLKLHRHRLQRSEQFDTVLQQLFAEVFENDQPLSMRYRPSWDIEDERSAPRNMAVVATSGSAPGCSTAPATSDGATIEKLLLQMHDRRNRDLDLSTTTSGPHRDKFEFYLGDTVFTSIASTGQLRLVSLILRVVQARLLSEATDQSPILLLDDVLLELDLRRRSRFLAAMPEYQQAFFTFLPDEHYARFKSDATLIYNVENGDIHG